MDLLTAIPGLALAAGLAAPALARRLERHTAVVAARRTLQQSRTIRARY